MNNKDDKKPNGDLLYWIVWIAVIFAAIAIISAYHDRDNAELYAERDLTPTCGIIYYMGALEKACMDGAEPDMEYVEAAVNPVGCAVGSDVPEEPYDEEVPEPMYDLNNQEELAHVIYCEVGNLGEDAMYYCGSVVLNRVEDDRFPGTIHNVIFQPGQYSCTTDGNWQKFSNIPDICWEIAEDLLVNGSIIPPDVIFQAQFVQGPIWKQVGNTYFCY